MIKEIWRKNILMLGVYDDLSQHEKTMVKIVNRIAFFSSLLSLIYRVSVSIFNPESIIPFAVNPWSSVIDYGSICLILPTLVLNYYRQYDFAKLLMFIFFIIICLVNSLNLGLPFRTELYFFPLSAFVFVVFKQKRMAAFFFFLITVAYGWAASNVLLNHSDVDGVSFPLFLRIGIAFSVLFFTIYFMQLENTEYLREIEVKSKRLTEDRDELEKMNFTKDKIFSIISHDLRSPIGSLQGLLALVNDDTISKEDFKKASQGLEKQVFQLRSSLDELLTWARAQLHGINPVPEELIVRDQIMKVVNLLRNPARDKRIVVTTQIESDVKVFCDPNMLHSVLMNLVNNGIKFTPVGGAITLTAELKVNGTLITVEDTGIGIPAENIDKILNPTVLFTTRGTNNEKGTGLGLAMCMEFVKKNNGTFSILSEDGKGSQFVIMLPSKK